MPGYSRRTADGPIFLDGRLGPHCSCCNWIGAFLCDWPIEGRKTCSAPICEGHAHEVGPDRHYCPAHLAESDQVNGEPFSLEPRAAHGSDR